MSRTLDRIAALLAQAEGTTNTHEAEAFLAKAQHLASLTAIDLEVARQHQRTKTARETPVLRRVTIAPRSNGRTANNAPELCNLFMAIGNVNDLEFDISYNSSWLNAYGLTSDIDVTEALYASLVTQMTAGAQAAITAGVHKEEGPTKTWDDRRGQYRLLRPDARRFKTAFYRAFTSRIGARLALAKAEAIAEIEQTRKQELADLAALSTHAAPVSTETGLVLREKAAEVKAYRAATTTARGTWGGGRRTVTSNAGTRSGRAAGDSARLGASTSLPGARKAVTS